MTVDNTGDPIEIIPCRPHVVASRCVVIEMYEIRSPVTVVICWKKTRIRRITIDTVPQRSQIGVGKKCKRAVPF